MARKYSILALIPFIFILSCQDKSTRDSENEKSQELQIVYSNWSEGIAASFLAKNILEDNFNYKVVPILVPVDSAYLQLAAGKADILMDSWLPQTHSRYYEKTRENIIDAGVLFENAKAGLLVPEEAQIKSIAALENYCDTIYGIGRSGVVNDTREALEAYELDLFLLEEDEERMISQLDNLYKRKQPVVITGWRPHPIFAKYDLRFLEDPKAVFPTSDAIHILLSKQAAEQHPRIQQLFERMKLNQQQFQELILQVNSHPEGEEAGAAKWIRENSIIVEQWLKNFIPFEAKPM